MTDDDALLDTLCVEYFDDILADEGLSVYLRIGGNGRSSITQHIGDDQAVPQVFEVGYLMSPVVRCRRESMHEEKIWEILCRCNGEVVVIETPGGLEVFVQAGVHVQSRG